MIVSITLDNNVGGIATSLISYSKAINLFYDKHIVILPKDAEIIVFKYNNEPRDYFCILIGKANKKKSTSFIPTVRIHSQCVTGDIFHSLKCDCGSQLAMALERIASEGKGMIIYMAQEGRGIGLVNKIRAYELQDQGMDTVEANEALGFAADERDYSYCKEILSSVNISSVKLMTNNPRKINGLEEVGIKVTERVPVQIDPNKHNENYLKVKADKLGHMLTDSD